MRYHIHIYSRREGGSYTPSTSGVVSGCWLGRQHWGPPASAPVIRGYLLLAQQRSCVKPPAAACLRQCPRQCPLRGISCCASECWATGCHRCGGKHFVVGDMAGWASRVWVRAARSARTPLTPAPLGLNSAARWGPWHRETTCKCSMRNMGGIPSRTCRKQLCIYDRSAGAAVQWRTVQLSKKLSKIQPNFMHCKLEVSSQSPSPNALAGLKVTLTVS